MLKHHGKIMPRKKGIDIKDKKKVDEILRECEEQNKRTDDALRNTEEHYQMIFNGMTEGFCVIEVLFDDNEKPVDYRFLEVNPAFEKQTGLVNAVGKRMREFAPELEEYWFEIYGKVAITGEPANFQNQAEQLNRWYTVNAFRIGKPDDRQVAIFFNDIADQKRTEANSIVDTTKLMKAEDALRENEERFRTLADNILQLTWMTDESGYIFWYNKRWYDYTGTTFEEMQGWGWEKVHHPDHIDRVMKIWTGALKEGTPWEDIFPLRSKEGEYGWFLSRAMPIRDDNGKILRWFGTNTDITERMKYEDALKEAYKNIEERFKEKEVLLRELYHRTKNNMQVVYSLLGLKVAAVEDKATKEILMDVGNRIQAIALVHEKLYQSKNLSRIDLKDYITDLTSLLMGSYNSTEKNIGLFLDLESINVLIDTAIPCGQIIIELISNSFKHAFPDGRDGKISIHLSRNKNDLIKLTISDNGIGIRNYSDITGGQTLGIQLFKNIAEDQLQGELSYNMENGVSWTVRFKDVLYDERV